MYPYASEYVKGSREYLESLSRAESDINPVYYSGEMGYLKLPKISSGICMDQFGNLFKFQHKDDFYETAVVDHIACGFQSPLPKYDGDSFLEEYELRKAFEVTRDGKEFIQISSLSIKQEKVLQSLYGERFKEVKLIPYDLYVHWHYYWYQDEKQLLRDEVYKWLGV